jgi:hypothetical protein
LNSLLYHSPLSSPSLIDRFYTSSTLLLQRHTHLSTLLGEASTLIHMYKEHSTPGSSVLANARTSLTPHAVFLGCAPLKHLPYIVIILLVSRKSKMPLGEETSNWSRWDLSGENRTQSQRCFLGRLGYFGVSLEYPV